MDLLKTNSSRILTSSIDPTDTVLEAEALALKEATVTALGDLVIMQNYIKHFGDLVIMQNYIKHFRK